MSTALLLALGLLAPVTRADDPVPTPTAAVISPEDAHRVRPVAEVPRRVDRIVRGPRRGELILLEWGGGVEAVDDAGFRTLRTLAQGHRPTDVAVSPDGKRLTWAERDDTAYTVQDMAGGESFEIEVGGHPGHAAFGGDGERLAIGYTFWDPIAEGAGHSEMRLYDASGRLIRALDKVPPGALRPVFSPDGKTLAVGNRNAETLLFDAATGERLHTLEREMTQEIAFSPDGKTLAAGYVDGTVALWDIATGELLRSTPSGCREVFSVDWSPRGDVLATSGLDGKIVLWEPGELARLVELDAPFWVIQVRFTADGTRLLSSSSSDHYAKKDRKITVWAVAGEAEKQP
jgi:WD40 repeat protein